MKKHTRTNATGIDEKVKWNVWHRDNHECIFCHSCHASPEAHVISRAYGGMGVEKNIVTACANCHRAMDNSTNREWFVNRAKKYLREIYGDFDDEEVIYKK